MISNQVLQQITQNEFDRLERIKTAWDAYDGNLPKQLKATKSDPQARDNILLNFAQPIVDKGVSFLMGKQVGFDVDGTPDSKEDIWLEAFWKQNRRMTLLHKAAINGGVTGDVFLRMMLPRPGQDYPRLVNLDPANVSVVYDADDYEDVLGYQIKWTTRDPVTGKPMSRRHIIEREGRIWSITAQESVGDSQNWRLLGVQTWPYSWCPVHHCQNLPMPNSFFGISDLETHVLSVNNAINFVLSNMARIIRLHAHPKTYAKGMGGGKVEMGPDDVLILPSEKADIGTLEMQSDLSSSLELYKRLKEVLHEITRIPEVATGKVDSVGALSGVALQILYQSLIEKTDTKQLFYGEMLSEICEHALEFGRKGDTHLITISWPEPLPKDAQAEAETATLLETLGVSRDTLLTNMGYDAKAESDKKAKEQKDAKALGDSLLAEFERNGMTNPDAGNDNGQNP